MPTQIGIGFSQLPDLNEAAKEAAIRAKSQINASSTDLVLLFSTIHYANKDILETIGRILQPTRLLGCTSAGILLSDHIETRGIGLVAFNTDEMTFSIGSTQNMGGQELRQTGFNLARDINENFKYSQRNAFLFFADSMFKNNSPFVNGIQEVLGNGFPIVGGVSCDDFNLKRSFQYFQKSMVSNSGVALLMGGQNVVLGSRHGWRPLGKPRVIDKVDGHVVVTIDGKPACRLYEEYLDIDVKDLTPAQLRTIATLYPLGLLIEEDHDYLLRNAIDIWEDGSIVCNGEVRQGAEVHLMIGNKDSCKVATMEAAVDVRDQLDGRQAKFIFIIESMTRHKLLGRNAFQEIDIIKEVLGYTTPMFGIYTYGEISPFKTTKNPNTHLQNESIVITAIG